MNQTLREDANQIISAAIRYVQPRKAVQDIVADYPFGSGKIILIAVGKASWEMALAAWDELGSQIADGVVISKYGHIMGSIGNLRCFEAGHPIPDERSYEATKQALDTVKGLQPHDTVLFLLSGGGSALFEQPLIDPTELQEITTRLLACGADIVEINTIRKRFSGVKGGRFAMHCAPAKVLSIVLSDIIGDPLDMIASGPAYPDASTCQQALTIASKYNLQLSATAQNCLSMETPKKLDSIEIYVTGSVRQLCYAAIEECQNLGYQPILLSNRLCCQAKEAGSFLASVVQTHAGGGKPLAFIAGGETVVKLTGRGLGGRNQELALSAAPMIDGLNAAVFSIGSDGTDGPTTAAGGYVDGQSNKILLDKGITVFQVLEENDSYHALEACGGLIVTGATGSNVNDLSVALIRE